jgi:hypothetical protein
MAPPTATAGHARARSPSASPVRAPPGGQRSGFTGWQVSSRRRRQLVGTRGRRPAQHLDGSRLTRLILRRLRSDARGPRPADRFGGVVLEQVPGSVGVKIEGAHPGYITWERYVQDQEKLRQNTRAPLARRARMVGRFCPCGVCAAPGGRGCAEGPGAKVATSTSTPAGSRASV